MIKQKVILFLVSLALPGLFLHAVGDKSKRKQKDMSASIVSHQASKYQKADNNGQASSSHDVIDSSKNNLLAEFNRLKKQIESYYVKPEYKERESSSHNGVSRAHPEITYSSDDALKSLDIPLFQGHQTLLHCLAQDNKEKEFINVIKRYNDRNNYLSSTLIKKQWAMYCLKKDNEGYTVLDHIVKNSNDKLLYTVITCGDVTFDNQIDDDKYTVLSHFIHYFHGSSVLRHLIENKGICVKNMLYNILHYNSACLPSFLDVYCTLKKTKRCKAHREFVSLVSKSLKNMSNGVYNCRNQYTYRSSITCDVFDACALYAQSDSHVEKIMSFLYMSLISHPDVSISDAQERYKSSYITEQTIKYYFSLFKPIKDVLNLLKGDCNNLFMRTCKITSAHSYYSRLVKIGCFLFDKISDENNTIRYEDMCALENFCRHMLRACIDYDDTGRLLRSFMGFVFSRESYSGCEDILIKKGYSSWSLFVDRSGFKSLMTRIAQKGNRHHVDAIKPYITSYTDIYDEYSKHHACSWLCVALGWANLQIIDFCAGHKLLLDTKATDAKPVFMSSDTFDSFPSTHKFSENDIFNHIFPESPSVKAYIRSSAVDFIKSIMNNPYSDDDTDITATTSDLTYISSFIITYEKIRGDDQTLMNNLRWIYRRYVKERDAVLNDYSCQIQGTKKIYNINDIMNMADFLCIDLDRVKNILSEDYRLCQSVDDVVSIVDSKIQQAGGIQKIYEQCSSSHYHQIDLCLHTESFRKKLSDIVGITSPGDNYKNIILIMKMYVEAQKKGSIYMIMKSFMSKGMLQYASMHPEVSDCTKDVLFDDRNLSVKESKQSVWPHLCFEATHNTFFLKQSVSNYLNIYRNEYLQSDVLPDHSMDQETLFVPHRKKYELFFDQSNNQDGMSSNNRIASHYMPFIYFLKKRASLLSIFSQDTYRDNLMRYMLKDNAQSVLRENNKTKNVFPREITGHIASYMPVSFSHIT
jgi:hypothetical protein